LPESIRIDLIRGPGEHIISADPTRIQQVVVNLALNARDAMPKGGELRIALSRTTEAEGTRCTTCGEIIEGKWVLLAVTDTGSGIPPDVLSRIFEPFFTTKAPLGHGLGLAQTYGIMKQHEGHIKVETQVGHGTTFTLCWPALSDALIEEQAQTQPVVTQGQGECILIVEDNETLRAALARVLKTLNYKVLEAANGREALAVLDQHRDRVRLVISDRVMPIMGGLELVHELSQRQFQVRVLMMTGYRLGELTSESTPEGVVGWVQKPPSVEQLSERVARALAEGPEHTVRANDD
jgi:CheY-like chemotaxis protein